MNRKIARIQELLAAGWDVDEIESDDDRIRVRLVRGTSSLGLALDRQDAWDVLYGEAFELRGKPADRPAAELLH